MITATASILCLAIGYCIGVVRGTKQVGRDIAREFPEIASLMAVAIRARARRSTK